MKMLPSGILDNAANHIDRHGWAQDEWVDRITDDNGLVLPIEECPMCAGAAINNAGDFVPEYDEHYDGPTLQALEAFATHIGDLPTAPEFTFDVLDIIANWNDADGRTQDEVVAALRAVAEKLRGEGR
jgi:hypothetical protein